MHNEIILGAGPSGLSYSLFSTENKFILEKNEYPGGHASSFFVDGFTFDYGPHILFSKDKDILQFIIDSLDGNINKCKRNNKVSFKEKLIKYPFENDLSSLDSSDNFECISEFIFNKYKEEFPNPKNMKEWFLNVFGRGISEKYLIPYNEKVWNIPVEKLSMQWSDRIPNPPPIDVLRSSIGIPTDGYLHQLYYYYPNSGGYQAISERWARGCNVQYDCEVTKINKKDGYFEIETSLNRYSSKKITSTINLSSLIKACAEWLPAEIKEAYENLIINPMYVVSIGIKGLDKNNYTAIYFADQDFLVNRISYPATFSKNNSPEGTYSIQAEITYSPDSHIKDYTDHQIVDHVLDGLKQRGLIDGEVILVDLKRVGESYVVYDVGYEKYAELIRNYFSSININLVGRFSYFEYINVDMAVKRSLASASMANLSKMNEQSLFKLALSKLQ